MDNTTLIKPIFNKIEFSSDIPNQTSNFGKEPKGTNVKTAEDCKNFYVYSLIPRYFQI